MNKRKWLAWYERPRYEIWTNVGTANTPVLVRAYEYGKEVSV